MCRFPEDVMRQIISYLHQPIPTANQLEVTWKELNQKDLSTMMRVSRMTYSIAAPMLYKEVDVNNLASFFLGVDDRVRPHHQNCTTQPSTQSHLCHFVIKRDGGPYLCSRHMTPEDNTPTATPVPDAFAIYHKQELLAKVEALHFVYTSADNNIYNGIDIDTSQPDPLPDCTLFEQCDTRRYMSVPKCVEDLQFSFNPLVNLRRATVGRFMGKAWNENTTSKPVMWGSRDRTELAIARAKHEYYLAEDMPQIAPRFVCRSATVGLLTTYPYMPDQIEVNVLHRPNLLEYAQNLVLGVLNIVHITPSQGLPAEQIYVDNHEDIVDSFLEAFSDWKDSFDKDDLEMTFVRFVIHRDNTEYSDDEEFNNRYEVDINTAMFEFWALFRSKLAPQALDLGFEVDLDECFDICWTEEEGDCPACRPDTCHPAYKTASFCNHLSRYFYDEDHKA